jgi:hypothetical protein
VAQGDVGLNVMAVTEWGDPAETETPMRGQRDSTPDLSSVCLKEAIARAKTQSERREATGPCVGRKRAEDW